MSHRTYGDGDIEVTRAVGDLRVTIAGPADQALSLLRDIGGLRGRAGSPGGSTGFEVVDAPRASGSQLEHRDEIERGFVDCPSHLVLGGSRLSGSTTSGADRVRRAWRAGQWAEAARAGRVATPSRSSPLDLKPRFYCVLRADSLESPTVFKSAKSYWACVGDLATSTSISHGFPSEVEARTFFAGAGVESYDTLK